MDREDEYVGSRHAAGDEKSRKRRKKERKAKG
jgi:hypothetical protein